MPPLKLTDKYELATVLLKPPPTVVIWPVPDAPVEVKPVAAKAWLIMVDPTITAVVPEPAERSVPTRVNFPVSTAAVPAPNVMVQIDASAVEPAVPKRMFTIGVAVPAAVFTMSKTTSYCRPAMVTPDGSRIDDPASNVSAA